MHSKSRHSNMIYCMSQSCHVQRILNIWWMMMRRRIIACCMPPMTQYQQPLACRRSSTSNDHKFYSPTQHNSTQLISTRFSLQRTPPPPSVSCVHSIRSHTSQMKACMNFKCQERTDGPTEISNQAVHYNFVSNIKRSLLLTKCATKTLTTGFHIVTVFCQHSGDINVNTVFWHTLTLQPAASHGVVCKCSYLWLNSVTQNQLPTSLHSLINVSATQKVFIYANVYTLKPSTNKKRVNKKFCHLTTNFFTNSVSASRKCLNVM